jgi:hypothetical protein
VICSLSIERSSRYKQIWRDAVPDSNISSTYTRRNNDSASVSFRKMLLLHGVSTIGSPDSARFGVLDNPAIAHFYSRWLTSDHYISFGAPLLRLPASAPVNSHPLSSNMEPPAMRLSVYRVDFPSLRSSLLQGVVYE